MSTQYNCSDLGAHEKITCGTPAKGGICTIGLLQADWVGLVDFSDIGQTNAAIAAGALKLIKGVRGGIPEPSEQKGDSLVSCGPEERTYNYDRTITWIDGNVTDGNDDFYDTLKRTNEYRVIAYNGTESTVQVTQTSCTFTVKELTPDTKKQPQKYAVTALWEYLDMPQRYDAPAGIYA